MPRSATPQPMPSRAQALRELAGLFLKLGTIGFGGPAAHIALMEDEVVRRRGWLDRQSFLDLVGAANCIPGPNSTELAIHIGYRRAGWPGLFVAGACFILPAFVIVAIIAAFYVRFGQLPAGQALLWGIKPVVLAVVIQALWRLGMTAIQSIPLAVIGLLCAAANLLGGHELLVLAGGALLASLARSKTNPSVLPAISPGAPLLPPSLLAATLPPTTAAVSLAVPFSLSGLFWTFCKIGSVLFGSGYVLLAFLQSDLVERLGWLSEAQLLDAVAVGQITPGPVFTAATFVGFLLAGWPGAMVATVGIFLPAFVFVALSAPWVDRLRKSPLMAQLLDGLNVASLALMAVVSLVLARSAVVDAGSLGIFLLTGVLLLRWRVNSALLVGLGALAGLFKAWIV